MSTRGSTFAAFGTAVALLTLTACGAAASSDTASSPGNAIPAAATSGPDVGAPPGAKVLGRPAVGESFKLTIDSANEAQPHAFDITVEDVTCGEPLDPKVLAHAAESVGDPTQNPTPESGKQFCVVAMDLLNVGKSEANWFVGDAVTVNVDDTAYSQSQTDAAYASDYADYWSDQGESGPTYGLNPGSRGPAHAILQIPEAEESTTLWFASSTWLEGPTGPEPGHLVQLDPAS
ncbi:hypothetical protein [Streptomyces arboris]|uniref:DUF4352 domain-containing protein n=1 Tax=Streptomyces arboris TaxID=2600619 RepID=A0A5N5EEI9_9ACTN|nr:hypothetical protein [Streptomyces arboris]KAB2588473.1 hypothetical protein F5983_32070 [Streptomyces arboris]